jgi:YbbR domain-containing protein
VKVPYGVEVVQVVPATLSLELEKSSRRTVPVVPALEGEPAPGYIVGPRSSDPATVEVIGPESRVRRLADATTEPVRIDGQRDMVRDVVTVGVTDAAVRLVEPRSATVSVEILPAPIERAVENVPVRWRNLGARYQARVAPSLAQVLIRGDQEVLTKVSPDAIQAFVDLAGLGPGRYNLRVQVDPSQDFGIASVTPAVVEVTIR